MILVAGIAEESPISMVVEALEAIGATYCLFDQRQVSVSDITFRIENGVGGGAICGTLLIQGHAYQLEQITGLYLRTMDDQELPDIAALPEDAIARRHCRRFHELLLRFADLMPGRVLNRPADMASNQSKSYQAQIVRAAGFDIPETVITNDPSTARAFIEEAWADADSVIYKSVSGLRSIVQEVRQSDLSRLDHIRWCPTQFQRRVVGTDIRAHVVGQTVLAARIISDAIDYRYATRQIGVKPIIEAFEIDANVARQCVELSRRLDLPLAGIDLRRTPQGRHVCFEVNPSPAFSFYEQHAGVPIASRIARYLAGEAN
jgi:glutathione synthase/RimK-type ligase-like ATP-grasp enzyme